MNSFILFYGTAQLPVDLHIMQTNTKGNIKADILKKLMSTEWGKLFLLRTKPYFKLAKIFMKGVSLFHMFFLRHLRDVLIFISYLISDSWGSVKKGIRTVILVIVFQRAVLAFQPFPLCSKVVNNVNFGWKSACIKATEGNTFTFTIPFEF